ncbi:MAG: DUF378 domain-containing protein [Chlamydiae bacterium]|nr:DUF378 domain-containing protein [Chlamydiota bacterium]MBI3277127.1 DUF378 domain-containing protein [Chlamydiota bacterium]
MKGRCPLCKIFGLLCMIGAVNWGLIGAFNFNLVAKLLGDMTLISRAAYILVGISGLLGLIGFVKECPACCKKTGDSGK